MKRILRKVLITLAAVIGLALLAEGALQLMFRAKRQARMAEDEIQAHLGRGYSYDPDLYWYWTELPDPGGAVNEHGFRRNKPMQPIPPEGVTRVITFGDSQTFGGGVDTEHTFSHYAEDALGPPWEVLNAGLSGYRSLNVYRLLRRRMLAYDPDIILIDCMPKDSPREDGPLMEASLRHGKVPEWLWQSRLYYFGQLMMRAAGLAPWETLPWPLQLHEIRERMDDPTKGDLRDSPDMGNLDLIGRWATQNGIQAMFMKYPYNKNNKKVGCHAWEGSMPEGHPVFDACQALVDSKKPASELFFDKNHLKPEGNRIVGEALAAQLRGMK